MNDIEKNNDEVEKDVGSEETSEQSYIPGKPYSKIRREINEEDLSSPAVQRILLGEVDKLQSKVSFLEKIEEKYHLADKECAVLNEKIKALTSQEVLYGFCLTIGSAIIGLSSLVWEAGYGPISIGVGSLLVIGAILSKVIKWN